MRRTLFGLLFIVLLAPSGWFAWRNRSMPQLGQKHDDAIYLIVSQSLADRGTYRIASLPGEPFETKYPPVLPSLLTIAWLSGLPFPDNLQIATAIEWMAIPPLLWLCLRFYRRIGISRWERWTAVSLLAISPYTVAMGGGVFTEAWFGVFMVSSLIACDHARTNERALRWALAGGVFAGLAYLTRTAGIAALLSGPAAFLLWRKRREALFYTAVMASCVAAWTGWAHVHRTRAVDVVSMYNTDYVGFQFLDTTWRDMGVVVWTNLAHLLNGIAALPFPLKIDILPWQVLLWAVAVGMIIGLLRYRHNRALWAYLLFCGFSVLIQLLWNYPPDLRFLHPLAPLFAIGLIAEGKNIIGMVSASTRSPRQSDRIAAWGVGLGVAALASVGVFMNVYMDFGMLHQEIVQNTRYRSEQIEIFRWIEKNVPTGEAVLTANPALFLYTGRKTASVIQIPIYWYRQDSARFDAPFRALRTYAVEHGMTYACLNSSAIEGAGPGVGFAEVFRTAKTSLYRISNGNERITTQTFSHQ